MRDTPFHAIILLIEALSPASFCLSSCVDFYEEYLSFHQSPAPCSEEYYVRINAIATLDAAFANYRALATRLADEILPQHAARCQMSGTVPRERPKALFSMMPFIAMTRDALDAHNIALRRLLGFFIADDAPRVLVAMAGNTMMRYMSNRHLDIDAAMGTLSSPLAAFCVFA